MLSGYRGRAPKSCRPRGSGWPRAQAKVRGEGVDEAQCAQEDRDTVDRWVEAEGPDLEVESEPAKANLRSVNRAQE